MLSTSALQWPLPTESTLRQAVFSGRLTAAHQLALLRDGLYPALTPEHHDERLASAARAHWGWNGVRPSVMNHWMLAGEESSANTAPWPIHPDGPLPAWGEGSPHAAAFARVAVLACLVLEGANPWAWDQTDKVGTHGLAEWAIAHHAPGLLGQWLHHPQAPSVQALSARVLDRTSTDRQSPLVPWLHAAAAAPTEHLLTLLLGQGFDPNQPDKLGRTPLFYARTPAQAQQLLGAGARLDAQDQAQERVWAFWARTRQDFAEVWAPHFAQQGPSADQRQISEAFGLAGRGEWQALEPILQEAPAERLAWRQPVAGRNGKEHAVPLWAFAALNTLNPTQSGGVAYHWNRLDAQGGLGGMTPLLIAHARDEDLWAEVLSGVPAGLLWLRSLYNAQPQKRTHDLRRNPIDNAAHAQWCTWVQEWEDRLGQAWVTQHAGAPMPPVAALMLSAMHKATPLWGTPSKWRGWAEREAGRLFGGSYPHTNGGQWEADREHGLSRQATPESRAERQAQWHHAWPVLLPLLHTKPGRAVLGPALIGALSHKSTQADGTLVPLLPKPIAEELWPLLWLTTAEACNNTASSEKDLRPRMHHLDGAWLNAGVAVREDLIPRAARAVFDQWITQGPYHQARQAQQLAEAMGEVQGVTPAGPPRRLRL